MIEDIVEEINKYLMSSFYFEMAFYRYDDNRLTVVGSNDLLYYHEIEVYFDKVFLIVGKVDFHTDSTKPVLHILRDREFNLKYGMEEGYTVFYFTDDDGRQTFIAANGISYEVKTVKYYTE